MTLYDPQFLKRLEDVTNLLVDRNFGTISQLGLFRDDFPESEQIKGIIEFLDSYPATFIHSSNDFWRYICVYPLGRTGLEWSVYISLTTQEEGRSDAEIQLACRILGENIEPYEIVDVLVR